MRTTLPMRGDKESAGEERADFWVFVPQMRMTMEQLVDRARAAEAAGFGGMASMDHMAPPAAESSPMFEAMITNAWLAAWTDRLHVGSLVLCDSFRHPAVLAPRGGLPRPCLRRAVRTRHRVGIGRRGTHHLRHRLSRTEGPVEQAPGVVGDHHGALGRETLDYEGEHFSLHGAEQQPGPLGKIPITIGGAGKGTMRLVATFADWWNVHIGIVDKLEEMRPFSGNAKCSVQVQVAFVPPSGVRGGDRSGGAPPLRPPHPGRRRGR